MGLCSRAEELFGNLDLAGDLAYYAGKVNACTDAGDFNGMYDNYEQLEAVAELARECGHTVMMDVTHKEDWITIKSLIVDGERLL